MQKIGYLVSFLFLFQFYSFSQNYKKPVTRAVVIGISDYGDEKIPDLNFANRDAEEFVNYLKSKSGGEFSDEHIMLLTNEDATYAQIYSALDWLLEESQPKDKVLIYFSGHGDVESKIIRQQGFLLTHNTPSNNYRIGSLRVEDVNAYLETLAQENGAKVVLMTDACRSGNLAGGTVGVQATAKALATQFENTVKIMSCQANELSLEGTQWGGGRGVFSFHLIDGLVGMADKNEDLQVNLMELRRYLEDKVTEETSFSQMPVVHGAMGTSLSFVDPDALAELKERRKVEEDLFGAVAAKGNMFSNTDSTYHQLYEEFTAAIENKYFLPSDKTIEQEPNKSASELYDILSKEPSMKAYHSLMKRNFASSLQDEAQYALNAYLKADPQEMAERWESDGQAYESNARWLQKAVEILGTSHRLHNQLLSKQYYYEGVLLRLEGEKKRNKELYTQALEMEKKALKLDDEAAYVYNELGLIYGNLNDREKEEDNYKKAMEYAPTWVLPSNNLSSMYNFQGNYEEALKYGKIALNLKSNLASPLYNVGTAYYGLGDLEKADSIYQLCIQKYPNHARAYYALGYMAYEKKEYKEAENYYIKALEHKPNYPGCYLNFGILYLVMKEYKKAEEKHLKLLELRPQHKWGHYNMMCIKSLQGQTKEALEWMEKTLQVGFTDYDYLKNDKELGAIKNLPEFGALLKKYFPEKEK